MFGYFYFGFNMQDGVLKNAMHNLFFFYITFYPIFNFIIPFIISGSLLIFDSIKNSKSNELLYKNIEDTLGIMVIFIRNEISNLSSNPGQESRHIIHSGNTLRQSMNPTILLPVLGDLGMTTNPGEGKSYMERDELHQAIPAQDMQ